MQFKSLNRTISEQTKEFEMILLWEKFFVCSEIESLSLVYGYIEPLKRFSVNT